MIVFWLLRQLRLPKERGRKSIALFDEALDSRRIKSVAHDQKAVVVKRLSLLCCEWNKIHGAAPSGCRPSLSACSSFSDDATVLHLVVDRRHDRGVRQQGLHICFGVEGMTRFLLFRFVRLNVFSLNV